MAAILKKFLASGMCILLFTTSCGVQGDSISDKKTESNNQEIVSTETTRTKTQVGNSIDALQEEYLSNPSIPQIKKYESSESLQENEKTFTGKISLAYLDEDSIDDFRLLNDNISAVSDGRKELIQDKLKKYNDNLSVEDSTSMDDVKECRYEQLDYIQRIDAHYLSILNITDEYEMQLSNNVQYECFNYDVIDGRLIALSEVIPDEKMLEKFLVSELDKLQNSYSVPFYSIDDCIDEHIISEYGAKNEDGKSGFTWYMDEQGITIIFEPYEIARNSCWINIPYTSQLVSDSFFPYKGERFVSEYKPIENQCSNY